MVTGPKVRSLDEYRAQDSEAVLLCVLDDVRNEPSDGLVVIHKPRGKPARTYATGEYARDPARGRDLLARVWARLAHDETPPTTVFGGT
jgi:hypothetical protein